MAETSLFKKSSNSFNEQSTSYEAEKSSKKKERKNSINSINSSNPDSSFNNLNSEIKSIIENETDLSFSSNSNKELEENKTNIEQFFDPKYWRVSKETNSETDEPISTYDSQNDKNSPFKKENFIILDKKDSPKPLHSKYAENQEMARISFGSNKQSTQSNEDEETRDHLHNISYCDSNNNSPKASLDNNENEEKQKKIRTENTKENKQEEKNNENKKEVNKSNIYFNNNMNNKKIFMNGFNNYNNLPTLNYNNDSDYQYDSMNYKTNTNPFFHSIYLPQQMCSFMPNYNFQNINKNNFILNNNHTNTKQENFDKGLDSHALKENNNSRQNAQYYMNNMNNFNKKTDMVDLPLVLNQSNPQNNSINYQFPKINYNMLCYPQIQQMNASAQKPVINKINNSSNYLPEINNKEGLNNINDTKAKNNSNNTINNNSSANSNICPIIEQNNNKN